MLSIETLRVNFTKWLDVNFYEPRRLALSQSLLGKAQGIINDQPLLRLEEAPKYANDVGDMLSKQGGVFITKPILKTFVTEIFCDHGISPSRAIYSERLRNSFWALGNTQINSKPEGKDYICSSFQVAAFRENISRLVQLQKEGSLPGNIDGYKEMKPGDIRWLADKGLLGYSEDINGGYVLTDGVLRAYIRILDIIKPYVRIDEKDYNIASAAWIDLLSYNIYGDKEVANCVGKGFNYQQLTPFRSSALCKHKLKSISEWKCSRCSYASKCALRGMLASNTTRLVDEQYWYDEGLTEALTVF